MNLTVNSENFEFCIDKGYEEKILYSMFKLWLLTIATSYSVKQANRSFKSEYIIPQLLMLSCHKKELFGIAYFSKQISDDRLAHHVAVNLAVFAYYKGEKRLSQICKDLKLSRSYNYAMYKNLMYSLKYRETYLNVSNSVYGVLIGDNERKNPYNETEFYLFDQFLVAQLADEIQPIDIELINQ